MSQVLVTGAAGRIGTVLRGGLPERGWAVRSLDVVPMTDTRPGEEQVVADTTDLTAMEDAVAGVSAVVHLAGIATESTWPAISHANIEGTYCVLEAARRAGVSRVVLASSNHATGYTPRPDGGLLREVDAPPRPDTYYGVSKAAMEALGSLYVDRYGMDVVCLRIGSAFAEPTTVRHLSTWLSPGDQVRLVDAALRAPAPGFAVVWGVSANTRNWWDLTAARALGYEPADDAEVFASALVEAYGEPDLADPVHARVGGEYTLAQFDAENVEPPLPGGDIAPGSGAER
ncbi:NAD-dependent epimerase/dehydratase family protein [Geodermatophilus sabuli]|uniref:Uronate dehydrogenase n=1 Tax=Geodermatophilus sabuli TaxID=1564158 RepID=A0A285EC64_9ACTN|nr:NAD(P)-dependent oxidoreductase [Geodermatophilus sabuli]MBB3084808.1 uronate dehydrogenase [Geodermatophilus sabuli]SNX95784.1 uronate dehydrogenase [Geodermatophilus sabuli]